jgi:hypothetical protein
MFSGSLRDSLELSIWSAAAPYRAFRSRRNHYALESRHGKGGSFVDAIQGACGAGQAKHLLAQEKNTPIKHKVDM